MVREMPVIGEQETITTVLVIFAGSSHSILPVVNGTGKMIGLISLDEMLRAMLFSREEVALLEKVPFLADFLADVVENIDYISPLVIARDMMQAAFFFVREDESMLKAASLMINRNVNRVVVLSETNAPVGYISKNEVCRAFLVR